MRFATLTKFLIVAWAFCAQAGASGPLNSQFSDLMERAATVVGVKEHHGSVRIVPRKKGVTLELKKESIIFNGKTMSLPGSLSSWQTAMGKGIQCSEKGSLPIHCKREDLGIEFGTNPTNGKIVTFITVHFQSEVERFKRDSLAWGQPERPVPSFIMRNIFPGNFIVDGYRIDGGTRLWELQSRADRRRNIRCNVRDCKVPHGAFSENANLYMELDGDDTRGTIKWISIAADI